MSIFVDTGAFYALADSSDKHYQGAKAYYAANMKSGLFLTSEYVFVESWTFDSPQTGQNRLSEILGNYSYQHLSFATCNRFGSRAGMGNIQ